MAMTRMGYDATISAGEAPPRQLDLARRGFVWDVRAGVCVRRAMAVSDEVVDTMAPREWQAFLAHLDDPGCPTCGRAWGGVRGNVLSGEQFRRQTARGCR